MLAARGQARTPTTAALALQVERRLPVPFLVVDVARTAAGARIVIAWNDAQESGYAGASPLGVWQGIQAADR